MCVCVGGGVNSEGHYEDDESEIGVNGQGLSVTSPIAQLMKLLLQLFKSSCNPSEKAVI